MNKKGWIGISFITVLLALTIFGGLRYVKLRLREALVAQSNAIEAIRQSDAQLRGQLAAYAEENVSLRKEIDSLKSTQQARSEEYKSGHQEQTELIGKLREHIDEIRSRQAMDEMRSKTINLAEIKGSNGQNVFVGIGAGPRAEALAEDSGENRDAGSFNTSLGSSALAGNRTGAWNAAIGTWALGSNVGGNHNLAAGANALASNNSGSANVAVGSAAMYRNIAGDHNSAVGTQALYNLEYGANNSAFGRDALFTIKRGSWNSAFGVDSLPGLEVGLGNSAFGGESGYTENRDAQHRLGSFNSWFGFQSGPATLKQVSNSIAIGYRAKNTESNQTVIGNVDTTEAIIFGALKIDRLCVGNACVDARSFEEMLRTQKR